MGYTTYANLNQGKGRKKNPIFLFFTETNILFGVILSCKMSILSSNHPGVSNILSLTGAHSPPVYSITTILNPQYKCHKND